MTKITIDKAVLEQVLEALKRNHYAMIEAGMLDQSVLNQTFTAHQYLRDSMRQAIEQPAQQEPVLVVEKEPDYWSGGHFYKGERSHIDPTKVWSLLIGTKLYTQPQTIDKSAAIRIATALGWEPKREWVGLTDEEIDRLWCEFPSCEFGFARAIEAKLKEKNT